MIHADKVRFSHVRLNFHLAISLATKLNISGRKLMIKHQILQFSLKCALVIFSVYFEFKFRKEVFSSLNIYVYENIHIFQQYSFNFCSFFFVFVFFLPYNLSLFIFFGDFQYLVVLKIALIAVKIALIVVKVMF